MTDEKRKLVEPEILKRAVVDSFIKLNPRTLMKNPVMFVVGVGSVLTTILFFKDLGSSSTTRTCSPGWWRCSSGSPCCSPTSPRRWPRGAGKAQADTLRKTRAGDGRARPARADGTIEEVPSTALDLGDECVVTAGEVIPSDGEIIEGIASVDESAITGESAPVIRESGGDRSAVTGGTRVLSDEIVVRITARPGETFIDRMIALVEGSERKKTPNEIALNILLAGLTIIFLLATVTLQPFAIYADAEQSVIVLVALLVCLIPTTIGGLLSAIGIAGHGPPRAAQRAGDERSRGRGGRRLRHAAARQDRHDHLRQPPGRRVPPGRRRDRAGARRRRAALEPGRRDAGGSVDRRAGQGPLRPARARARRRDARRRSPRRPA